MALTGPARSVVGQGVEDGSDLVVEGDPTPVLGTRTQPTPETDSEERKLFGQDPARPGQARCRNGGRRSGCRHRPPAARPLPRLGTTSARNPIPVDDVSVTSSSPRSP